MNTLSPLVANRTLTFIVLLAIAMWSFGLGIWTPITEAAAITVISDTLSDSDLGALSDHEFVFTVPGGVAADDSTITLTFPGEFNVSTSSVDFNHVDVDHGAGDLTIDAGCTGADIGVTFVAQAVILQVCSGQSGVLAAGGTTTIQIGDNAIGGAANEQMVNPTDAGSYAITVATSADTGETRVAIIDQVVVTASVDTTFVFTINGMPLGYTVNGSPTTTAAASTATLLPFGTIVPGATGGRTLAQNLNVTTNATNGFTVTVNQDQALTSSTGADIDTFTDGTSIASSTFWQGPLGNIGSEATYGHMGVTSEDDSPSADAQGFFDDLWAGNFVGTAREVFYHDGPADGAAAGQGSTTVGFQVEISSLQEAGSDYTANITYVATPIF